MTYNKTDFTDLSRLDAGLAFQRLPLTGAGRQWPLEVKDGQLWSSVTFFPVVNTADKTSALVAIVYTNTNVVWRGQPVGGQLLHNGLFRTNAYDYGDAFGKAVEAALMSGLLPVQGSNIYFLMELNTKPNLGGQSFLAALNMAIAGGPAIAYTGVLDDQGTGDLIGLGMKVDVCANYSTTLAILPNQNMNQADYELIPNALNAPCWSADYFMGLPTTPYDAQSLLLARNLGTLCAMLSGVSMVSQIVSKELARDFTEAQADEKRAKAAAVRNDPHFWQSLAKYEGMPPEPGNFESWERKYVILDTLSKQAQAINPSKNYQDWTSAFSKSVKKAIANYDQDKLITFAATLKAVQNKEESVVSMRHLMAKQTPAATNFKSGTVGQPAPTGVSQLDRLRAARLERRAQAMAQPNPTAGPEQ